MTRHDGTMTDEELNDKRARLPKWAQRELDLTRRRLDEERARWTKYAENRAAEAGRTDTIVGNGYDEHTYPLPRGETIRFVLDGDTIEAKVVRRGVSAELMLREATHSGQLVIAPRISNEVTVRVIRR